MRGLDSKFETKVTALKGDLAQDQLGLSDEDQNTLKNNTDIIFHNAANVKFDIRVNLALKTNVLGTKNMLDLAEQCKKLEIFMYISTAYSHCYQKDIQEIFYPSPADLTEVYLMMKKDTEIENGMQEQFLQTWLGKFPNIYTFSKAVSESLVEQYGKNSKYLCAVYRPSIGE